MEEINWSIENFLSVGENVIFKCDVEDEEYEITTKIFLTNYRIIWIEEDEFVKCIMLKFICEYGVNVGYENYGNSENDIGTGEYSVYFVSINEEIFERIWFYSEDVWKEFYDEISRAILERQQ